tara:strand:- start:726 stop:1109 length:384 start_codon:yes stop_codon:yes gene_type:complete
MSGGNGEDHEVQRVLHGLLRLQRALMAEEALFWCRVEGDAERSLFTDVYSQLHAPAEPITVPVRLTVQAAGGGDLAEAIDAVAHALVDGNVVGPGNIKEIGGERIDTEEAYVEVIIEDLLGVPQGEA